MNKWKKAVIHLECATDSEHLYDRIKRIDYLRKELKDGKITHDQFAEEITNSTRDLRYHGTAIFVAQNGRHYLITARHVLQDEYSAKREYQEESKRIQQWPEEMQQTLLESAEEKASNRIFNIIFRVPSLDQVLQSRTKTIGQFLMNLGAGPPSMAAYTFSNAELDLAVVSLNHSDSRFVEELISYGYEPITLNDIVEAPSKEGAEVYTVGFPSSTALLGQISQQRAVASWSSGFFSLPTFSFGRVSMLHNSLPFYWVDMSIYPGNSGGPVVENNKLVGIVSGQPTIPIEESEQFQTRIPFGMIIKAKYINELISIQQHKDGTAV